MRHVSCLLRVLSRRVKQTITCSCELHVRKDSCWQDPQLIVPTLPGVCVKSKRLQLIEFLTPCFTVGMRFIGKLCFSLIFFLDCKDCGGHAWWNFQVLIAWWGSQVWTNLKLSALLPLYLSAFERYFDLGVKSLFIMVSRRNPVSKPLLHWLRLFKMRQRFFLMFS